MDISYILIGGSAAVALVLIVLVVLAKLPPQKALAVTAPGVAAIIIGAILGDWILSAVPEAAAWVPLISIGGFTVVLGFALMTRRRAR